MNSQLTEVLSDLMGMTGQAIIRDIVVGQRDPRALARHRSGRIKASAEEVHMALTGNWREEHLFVLTQALAMYDSLAQRIGECDAKRYEEQQCQRSTAALKRRAAALGFTITPTPATA